MTSPPRPYPRNLIDQNFGLCIAPEDLIFPFYYHCGGNYCRPWRWFNQVGIKDSGSSISEENDTYKITLDVQHFKPEEISVRVNHNEIIVEANHEEKQDEHGFISRKFKRRYALPYECLPDTVESTLSSDGILILTSKKMTKLNTSKEIIVPIQICKTSKKTEQSNAVSITELKETEIKKSLKSKEEESTARNIEKQIMLKEEHSRLLKPELLGPAVAESKNKETSELTSVIATAEENSKSNTTAESSVNLEMSSAKESQLVQKSNGAVSDKISAVVGNISTTDVAQNSADTKEISGTSSVTVESCSQSQAISAPGASNNENNTPSMNNMNLMSGATAKSKEIMELLESSSARGSARATTTQERIEEMTMEISETKISGGGKPSGSLASEAAAARAGANSSIEQMIEKCGAEIADIANKYSDSSFMSSSDAANIKSMSSSSYSSSEIQESSYSSTSSSSTNMKASSDGARILVSDVIAELKEAAEIFEK